MILIFSNIDDHSTNEVCNILYQKNIKFLRINNYDFFQDLCISITNENNLKITYKNRDIINDIDSVWYRREPIFTQNLEEYPEECRDEILEILYREVKVIRDLFVKELSNKYWLSHPSTSNLNKLFVLSEAVKCGLNVPDTLVTSNKKDLTSFFHLSEKKIISKPLFEVRKIQYNNIQLLARTEVVKENKFKNFEPNFFISLVQKNIEKEAEIRIVFIEGFVYSMIIYSQKNRKTANDFRFYDLVQPTRFASFNLPNDITDKIKILMKEVSLNFGSIDLILDKSGNYFFLEVNPVGQFGMTSTPNNFGIEYKIAEILTSKIKAHEKIYN